MKVIKAAWLFFVCLTISISLQGKSDVTEKKYTIDPSKPVMVNFKGIDGDVYVEKTNKKEILFKFRKELRGRKSKRNREFFEKIQPDIKFIDNHLTIDIKIPRRRIRLFEFFSGPGIKITSRLYVPSHTDLRIRVIDGDVKVSDLEGEIQARSVDGDLNISSCTGGLELHTTDGDLIVDDCQGKIKCNTVDGDIEASGIFQGFYLKTTDGDCTLDLKKGSQLSEDCLVRSVDGDVRLGFAPGFGFKLSARASDGRISISNLELENVNRRKKNRLEGERGAADFKIEIKTTDGDIFLREY